MLNKIKFKKIKKTVMHLLAFCVLICAHFTAYAETTTEARIEITAGTGPTYPVDPEFPDESIEVGNPIEGSLAILSVSHFDFGTITIPVTETAGLYDITTNFPNIQVVDLRGSGTGWSVNASVTPFSNEEGTSLPGAVIHIYNGRPNSEVSSIYAPTQISNVSLTTDNTDTKVITAPDGTGMGLWVMRWYPAADEETTAYIKLGVPAGAATVGTHTATINWTLSDTP